MNRDNKTIIKALNMYGRVPEQWELLEEIERLNNRIDKAIKKLSSAVNHFKTQRENNVITFTLKILKGSDKE